MILIDKPIVIDNGGVTNNFSFVYEKNSNATFVSFYPAAKEFFFRVYVCVCKNKIKNFLTQK